MDDLNLPAFYSNEELLEREIRIVSNFSGSVLGTQTESDQIDSTNPIHQLTENLICGNFERVLQSDIAREALSVGNLVLDLKDTDTLSAVLQSALRHYLDDSGDSRICRQWSTYLLGIASLELFIQNNWTGPASSLHLLSCMLPAGYETKLHKDKIKQAADCALAELCVDDCNVYPLVSTPELLLLAKCILVDCVKDITSSYVTGNWWAVRCLWIWQQVLDERAPSIYKPIIPLIQKVSDNDTLMCKESHRDLCVTFHLECSHILNFYYDYQASKDHLQKAEKIAGLKVALAGALGKRTKWQSSNLPQLLLKVEKDMVAGATTHVKAAGAAKGLPKDLALNDDTILDAIRLEDPEEGKIPALSAVEQAVVLALGVEKKRMMPKDAFIGEELLPYVSTVLNESQTWSVHMAALSMRCQLEKDRRRTVERAMMQMQTLIDQWKDEQCPVIDRLKLFFATNLPPKWEMEKLLAGLFLSLGSTSAALEVYLRLHLWEDAVSCYQRLDKLDKAQRLINEQIAKKETPLMLCLLGDVTHERKHYERAWEVSGERSARAMKSLGLLCVHAEEYEKAIEYLEKSVEKNFLQYHAWFLLGYAAIKSKNYVVAARAYQRCVSLDHDNAEAWNNLSTSFIHLKDKTKAFRTLQEAIKCSYDNWHIWENFMITSTDLGEFGEAIRAYRRLIELKDKFVDEEVLGILVKAVCSDDILDAHGNPAKDMHKKLVELFGQVTSKVTNNAQIWSLYGQLHGSGQSDDPQANDKALQCLQRCHRLRSNSDEWLKDVKCCKEVMKQSEQLAQVYIRTSKSKSNAGEAIQMLSSAKLMIKAIVTKVKRKQEESQPYTSEWTELDEPLMELQATLETIIQQITLRKGQSS